MDKKAIQGAEPEQKVEQKIEPIVEHCSQCSDNRYEVIERAKQDLIESTNIRTSLQEMTCLDNFLFRCWQMGWLEKYNNVEQSKSNDQ